MRRLLVPVALVVGVVVETDDKDVAIAEARRFVECSSPEGHFIDGWNDIQRKEGKPLIYAVGDYDVDIVPASMVEEAEIDDEDAS